MNQNDFFQSIDNKKINKALNLFNKKNKKEKMIILKNLPDKVGANLVIFWVELIKSDNKWAHQLTNLLIDLKNIENQIAALINHDNKKVRRKAVLVLGKSLTKGNLKNINPLIKALKHDDLGVKSRVMVALSKAKIKKALPALEEVLKNSFADVQKKVIKTIYEIGGSQAKEILIKNKDIIDSDNKNVLNKYLSQLGYSLRSGINEKIKQKLENNLNLKNYKYLGLTVKGLETQAINSIKEKINIKVLKYFNGKIVFEYKGDVRELRKIRSLKKIYFLITIINKKEITPLFLKQRLKQVDINFLTDLFDKKDRFAFFVNLRNLKTRDIRPILGKGLKKWLKEKGFVTISKDYNLEVRGFLNKDQVLIGFNLVDFLNYNRKWRKDLSSTALKPYLSYLLVYLSDILKTDVFLDPMCGSGSIIIERALAGGYKKIIGADKNKKALKSAQKNISNINQNIRTYHWDATNLPLAKNSINKVVVDMPFGIRSGKHSKNIDLYFGFLKEMKRVLISGSKMIILSQEVSLINKGLAKMNCFKVENKIRINLSGLKPMIFVLQYK